MKFFCIADKDSGLGFKLAGIETRLVSTRTEALEALMVARATSDIGIILVTEKTAALIEEEVTQHITDQPIPLVLQIPSRGEVTRSKSAAELLKQLVGIGM